MFHQLSFICYVLLIFTYVAFYFVLPAKIIQKYNQNNNDPQLIDSELYNISIASLVLVLIAGLVIFKVDKSEMNILGTIFLIALPSMCISKEKGDNNINNYHLYVVSICTLVFIILSVRFRYIYHPKY
jgi:predicted permease